MIDPIKKAESRPLRRGALLAVGTLAAATALTACGSSATSPSSAPSTSGKSLYPVTITTCGQKVTFDKAPTRAVTNDINTFEDMAALGLEPHMVGDFALDGYGPNGTTDVPASLESAFKQVKQISPNGLTLEPLIGLHPDFLFAGWNYGLKVGSTLTPQNLANYGIKTLVLAESCAHVEPSKQAVSINDTYSDITNLGAIFGIPAKAAALVASMKAEIASVQAKIADTKPVSVFLYDSGTSAPFTAPGLAMPDALISLGGGTNVFHSLKQTWTTVSWEQVVASKPECILINDYGTPTYAQKVQYLETNPVTKDIPAVKNKCFIDLTYGELTPSPLNAYAVSVIAKALHPGSFS